MPAFELKLLVELGLQPDFEKENLKPDLQQILRVLLLEGDWSKVSRLKMTAAQRTALNRFLHGFLVYHLGKVPTSRDRAVE